MSIFYGTFQDETGCDFVAEYDAADRDAAREYFRENYPESALLRVESPADVVNEAQARYDRMNAMHDYPDLDDYGW